MAIWAEKFSNEDRASAKRSVGYPPTTGSRSHGVDVLREYDDDSDEEVILSKKIRFIQTCILLLRC